MNDLECSHISGRIYCDDCNANMIHARKWIRLTLAGDSFEVYGTEENIAKLSRFITGMAKTAPFKCNLDHDALVGEIFQKGIGNGVCPNCGKELGL